MSLYSIYACDKINLTEMDFLDKNFYKSCVETNNRIKSEKFEKIRLPKMKLLLGGEQYYDTLFKAIDRASYQIWLVNYTLENSLVGNIYLKKLIQASQRGVKCFVFIDNLVSNPNDELLQELKQAGGKVLYRNPKQYIWQMLVRSYFQRDHEKVCLADNVLILGSSNIASEYGGIKYGNNFFTDLNIYMKNVCIKDTLVFFDLMRRNLSGLDQYKIPKKHNYIDEYVRKFPESPFGWKNVNLLRSFYPWIEEIQHYMLERIKQAKSNIRIVSPYYYPIKEIDEALLDAKRRGVSVEFVTSLRRDVPAYKSLQNSVLFKEYIKEGIDVYEFTKNHLHAKAICVDGKYVNMGSFNLDHWSWYNNNEMNVEIANSPDISMQFDRIYYKLKKHSRKVEYKEDYESLIDKVKNRYWHWFLITSINLMCYRNFYQRFRKIYVPNDEYLEPTENMKDFIESDTGNLDDDRIKEDILQESKDGDKIKKIRNLKQKFSDRLNEILKTSKSNK